jgi:hypothetical protein
MFKATRRIAPGTRTHMMSGMSAMGSVTDLLTVTSYRFFFVIAVILRQFMAHASKWDWLVKYAHRVHY